MPFASLVPSNFMVQFDASMTLEVVKIVVPLIGGALLAYLGYLLSQNTEHKKARIEDLKRKLDAMYDHLFRSVSFFLDEHKYALLKKDSGLLPPDRLIDTYGLERIEFMSDVYFSEFKNISEELKRASVGLQAKLLEFWRTDAPTGMDNYQHLQSICEKAFEELNSVNSRFRGRIIEKFRSLI